MSDIKTILQIKRKSETHRTEAEKILLKYYSILFQIQEVVTEQQKENINSKEAIKEIRDVLNNY